MRTLILCCMLLGLGCDNAGNANDGKRMPNPPPPASHDLPAGLRIEVDIDGKAAAAIDAAKLGATAPHFEDNDRRAWRLSGLVGGPASEKGAVFSVTGEKGITITLHQPEGDDDPVPVLIVSRRGEIMAALIDPSQPFPPFHGRGGRLGRPGDPLPRISGVTRIQVRSTPPPRASANGDAG
jgi:hypothetical protein